MAWTICSKNPSLGYYTFKAITKWNEACYWKLFTRANQNYLSIYEKPYIIIFILHRGTRKGVDGMFLFFLVLLRQSEINETLLNSPLQDYTIFIGNNVIQHQMASFDLPSWIRYIGFHHSFKKARNNGNEHKIKSECL